MPSLAVEIENSEVAPAVALSTQKQRVVLTGFMGAGKSTVGRLLAAELGWQFVDVDALVEEMAGETIPEIFANGGAEGGEQRLRRLESRALARVLGQRQTVIALGGGAAETLGNRLLVEQTPGTVVVFLDAPFPVLFDRCMLQALDPAATARPNIADPAAAEVRFTLRRPLYRRMARVTVDVSSVEAKAAAAAVLAQLS